MPVSTSMRLQELQQQQNQLQQQQSQLQIQHAAINFRLIALRRRRNALNEIINGVNGLINIVTEQSEEINRIIQRIINALSPEYGINYNYANRNEQIHNIFANRREGSVATGVGEDYHLASALWQLQQELNYLNSQIGEQEMAQAQVGTTLAQIATDLGIIQTQIILEQRRI